MDPPYGIRFGTNFQPFVRDRSAPEDNDDEDLTREPEMVQAYRDTWELGLHSYLAYLRDRLFVAHKLLSPSGSLFVQINDENLPHVREVMDEVFGGDCFVVTIPVKKKGSQKSKTMAPVNDYLVWYSRSPRESGLVRFHRYFVKRELDGDTLAEFKMVELPDGREFNIKEVPDPRGKPRDYRLNPKQLFVDYPKARLFRANPLTIGGFRKNQSLPYTYKGVTYPMGEGKLANTGWKTTVRTDDGSKPGMDKLAEEGRLLAGEGQLRFKSYLDDFRFSQISNWWDGLGGASDPIYVVQTNTEIVQRCMLMTTDPGDLVLDPTCGSGTTAYVAEQWGRRWITTDVSRVPLALARQRLLTATFDYFDLKDDELGPAGGFVFKRKQNSRGEEVGGIVPHITLGSIANNEPATEEVLVDRPELVSRVTRVTGPVAFEATIPAPGDLDTGADSRGGECDPEERANHVQRMIEVLRRSPVLRLDGGRTITLRNVRPPAKTLALSAEAIQGADEAVAFVFGPDTGAVSEALVFQAAREANAKGYKHLYVIGFAIDPHARELIRTCEDTAGVPATYVQATPDLLMGDLLKNMRSSQIFSVCGLPEIEPTPLPPERKGAPGRWQVKLLGLDTFDPLTMEPSHLKAEEIPAWLLDTDYNGLCFHVSQAFFPRTGAWENLKRALRGHYEDTVWDHLAGDTSAPFEAGEHRQVAVKVIDRRGNELMVVKPLGDGRSSAKSASAGSNGSRMKRSSFRATSSSRDRTMAARRRCCRPSRPGASHSSAGGS